jgi:hypothetical protein
VSVEDRVQVGLMLAVGATAAAYSWSHVLDLAQAHGQAGWRAWAVALVVESAAVSGGLEVRRRRRQAQPARWALVALGAAVVLQVAAQVARAEPSVWGVILAVIPAVVFLLLVKIALARAPEPVAEPARVKTRVNRIRVSEPVSPAGERGREPRISAVSPAGDPVTAWLTAHRVTTLDRVTVARARGELGVSEATLKRRLRALKGSPDLAVAQ